MTAVAVPLAIYIPLIIYFAYPLYKRRNEPILRKRHSRLTLWSIYAQILIICAVSLVQLVFYVPVTKLIRDLIWSVFFFVVYFVSNGFYFLLLLRIWITFYDIRLSMITGCGEWQQIIDASYEIEKSWFIRHRRSFGNARRLKRIFFVGCFFESLFSLGLLGILPPNGLNVLVWMAPLFMTFVFYLVLSSVIFYHLKNFRYFDDLYVVEEFLTFYRGMAKYIVVFLACALILVLLWWHFLSKPSVDFFIALGLLSSVLTLHFPMWFHIWCTYIFTRWVFRIMSTDPALQAEYGEALDALSPSGHGMLELGDRSPMSPDPLNDTGRTKLKAAQVTLPQILVKREFVCSFMQHLSQEFSIECLLALIEFLQFRDSHLTG